MIGYTVADGRILNKENERLEFKSALKGVPSSTWETYSAFANSFGGVILLGVQDTTGVIEGVPNADLRVQDIWNTLNNQQVVNANILRNSDVSVLDLEGKTIISVNVPRADRYIRPIYYRNMETGTFKRNGEGDYHCKMPEIASMLRDRCSSSYDCTTLENTTFDDIDVDTLVAYRNEMRAVHPDHMWNGLDDTEFAKRIGAIGHSTSEMTVAGLLMFGKEEVISSYFPRFKLDYLECPLNNTAWSYRRVTGDGLWVGNVYNFFSIVRSRIGSDVDNPAMIGDDMHRVVDTETHKAIRECLINSLMHADYLGDLVVKIEKYPKLIVMSNSGLFRIPVEVAEKGGESDPRNAVIAKMFSFIGMSERAGIGVNYLFNTWTKQFGGIPMITEDTRVHRTTVELVLGRRLNTKGLDENILALIRTNPRISMDAIAEKLNVSRPTVSNHINTLKTNGVLKRVGGTRGHWECE